MDPLLKTNPSRLLPMLWLAYCYVLAPLSAHTAAMNSTILVEVSAAALVLCEVVRRAFGELRGKTQS